MLNQATVIQSSGQWYKMSFQLGNQEKQVDRYSYYLCFTGIIDFLQVQCKHSLYIVLYVCYPFVYFSRRKVTVNLCIIGIQHEYCIKRAGKGGGSSMLPGGTPNDDLPSGSYIAILFHYCLETFANVILKPGNCRIG